MNDGWEGFRKKEMCPHGGNIPAFVGGGEYGKS
jgi:hypothetical protein